MTPEAGDYYQVALASAKAGGVTVVWPAINNSVVNLYSRDYAGGSWSGVQRLTRRLGPDTSPRLAAGPTGDLFHVVAYGRATPYRGYSRQHV